MSLIASTIAQKCICMARPRNISSTALKVRHGHLVQTHHDRLAVTPKTP
jgi:hypothetical protein